MQNGASSTNGHGPVSENVPNELKTLIRTIMRTFYGFDLYLCMEMLMMYNCVKEEDLADLLRLDLKLVHEKLVNLKKDKFINEKIIMATSSDAKQSKHSYFYINYKMCVNVIKYKLDKIRIQIESEEKEFTTRASYKCTICKKTYTDLDTKDLFPSMTCLYCGNEVDEDVSSLPKGGQNRNLLIKFNTQLSIISELLSRVEHVRLAEFILRPEPFDMTAVLERVNNAGGSSASSNKNGASQLNGKAKLEKWSGDKTRNVDIFGQTKMSVNIGSSDGAQAGQRKAKELPSILIQNRTNEEDLDNVNSKDSILLSSVIKAADEITAASVAATKMDSTSVNTNNNNNKLQQTSLSNSSSGSAANSSSVGAASGGGAGQAGNLEAVIMQKLLKHEKKASIPGESDDAAADSAPASATSGTALNGSVLNEVGKSVSSITITKKRNFDEAIKLSESSNHLKALNGRVYEKDEGYLKKRRLNNGGRFLLFSFFFN
jgi:transcription initiation factor TFIIE subunit alpha